MGTVRSSMLRHCTSWRAFKSTAMNNRWLSSRYKMQTRARVSMAKSSLRLWRLGVVVVLPIMWLLTALVAGGPVAAISHGAGRVVVAVATTTPHVAAIMAADITAAVVITTIPRMVAVAPITITAWP